MDQQQQVGEGGEQEARHHQIFAEAIGADQQQGAHHTHQEDLENRVGGAEEIGVAVEGDLRDQQAQSGELRQGAIAHRIAAFLPQGG
ncbi:MAG: hypothetical protein ACKOPS_20195, partial [Cyanobium sp.]